MFSEKFTTEFRSEFETWRGTRPQWKALLKAVRAEAEADELRRLGAEAGADESELRELVQVRRRAKADEPLAAKYAALKRRLAELDKEIAALETKVREATANEHAEATGALQEAALKRDRFWRGEYIAAEQAHKFHQEVAEPMGLG